MKRLTGCCISILGFILTIPFLAIVLIILVGLTSLLGPTEPNVTHHFNIGNVGALTVNGKAVLPGWTTQVLSLGLAAAGWFLLRTARKSKRPATEIGEPDGPNNHIDGDS